MGLSESLVVWWMNSKQGMESEAQEYLRLVTHEFLNIFRERSMEIANGTQPVRLQHHGISYCTTTRRGASERNEILEGQRTQLIQEVCNSTWTKVHPGTRVWKRQQTRKEHKHNIYTDGYNLLLLARQIICRQRHNTTVLPGSHKNRFRNNQLTSQIVFLFLSRTTDFGLNKD